MLRILSAAQIRKRCVTRDNGEHCAKSLEGLALEASIGHPNSEWESILKQMIKAARSKNINQCHSCITKKEQSGVDYIEVPAEKRCYDPGCCEVYEFCEGLFLAHPKLPTTGQHFSLQEVLKKLPKKARVANIELKEDSIHLASHNAEQAPTWRKITKKEDISRRVAPAPKQETPPASLQQW